MFFKSKIQATTIQNTTLFSIVYTPRIAYVIVPRLNQRSYTYVYRQVVWLHREISTDPLSTIRSQHIPAGGIED